MNKEAKTLSNILCIIAKIFKVLCYIGIVFLTLFVILTPILFRNIEVDTQTKTISLGNQEVNYEINNNVFSLYYNNEEQFSLNLSNNDIAKINKFFSKDTKFYMLITEYIFISSIVYLTLILILLMRVEKLFSNIYKLDTPFTTENVNLIQEVAKYLVILAVAMYGLTILLEVVSGLTINMNINLNVIIYVLIIYLLSYIFDYGIKKEK